MIKQIKEIEQDVIQDNQNINVTNSPSLYFDNLYQQIRIMKEYGALLLTTDRIKGQTTVNLALQLENKTKDFAKKNHHSEQDIEQFKAEFKTLLHSEDKLMQKHRELWKPILTNILLALTGIGLLAIIINVTIEGLDSIVNKKPFTFNNALFFAQTNRQSYNTAIERSVESIHQQPQAVY